MILIDLNEIYKILYYSYILSFKVLDIFVVKQSQPFKTMGLNAKISIVSIKIIFHLNKLLFEKLNKIYFFLFF